MKNEMMEDKDTKTQWRLMAYAAILLIVGIVACVATANVWSNASVIIMGVIFGVVDVTLWVFFFKKTGWFTSRHEGGGSSVK